MDLGRSSSLSHEFSHWKFTRSLLPHPHFHSQPPHTGPTLDDPSSWGPGERVEECICGERSHGEWFAWQLWPFPRKSSSEETQALHTVRCSFPRKSWITYGAAGTEKLPGAAGNCDSHQPCHQLLAWAPLMACSKAVTAFVMAGTSHTQQLPMPQRNTRPNLAAQTEQVTQTLLFPPKPGLQPTGPRLLATLSKTIPGRMPSETKPQNNPHSQNTAKPSFT